jgi:hypothetical protein
MSIVPGRDVPEVPQAWVDAVNQAINDANHEDLCSSFHDLAECDSYRPGTWDIGVDLTIAVGVLDPLIRKQVVQPPDTLAESLAATVRNLQAYIEVRADEIAGPLITATQQRAAELERDLAMSEQRREDLATEFRRQLKARDRQVEQQATLIREHKDTIGRVWAARRWKNEDGKTFVFADDLIAALRNEEDPT